MLRWKNETSNNCLSCDNLNNDTKILQKCYNNCKTCIGHYEIDNDTKLKIIIVLNALIIIINWKTALIKIIVMILMQLIPGKIKKKLSYNFIKHLSKININI